MTLFGTLWNSALPEMRGRIVGMNVDCPGIGSVKLTANRSGINREGKFKWDAMKASNEDFMLGDWKDLVRVTEVEIAPFDGSEHYKMPGNIVNMIVLDDGYDCYGFDFHSRPYVPATQAAAG